MGSVLVLLRELSHVWCYGSDDEAEPRVGGVRGGGVEGRRSSIRIKSPAAVHVLPYRDSIQYMLLDDSRIVLLDCNWTPFVMRAKVSRLWQILLSVPHNYQRVGRTEYTVD